MMTSNRSVGEWGEVFGDAGVVPSDRRRSWTSTYSVHVLPACGIYR